jgi:hypothetical protein
MTIAQPLGALLSQPFRTIEGIVVAHERHVEVAERPPLRDAHGTVQLAR